ncbi:MAG: hypothetical protein H6766_07010 [Candidatus Peribacteria bacterium]|nr:MAG: hypothetical protein H6766_07010 [Candidatus Peribacteria bacterium]
MIAAQINICSIESDVCLTKSTQLTLVPGQMTDAIWTLPTATIAAGALVPVRIHATDAGGNMVGMQPYPLVGESLESRFENGPQQLTVASTTNPYNTTWRYRAPIATASMRQLRQNDGTDVITQSPQLTFDTLALTQSGSDGTLTTFDTKDIISTPATIQSRIVYAGESAESLAIALDPSMDQNDPDSLPRMVITVRDQQGNPLPDQFLTLTTNTVRAHLIDTNGETPSLWMTDEQGQIIASVVPHGSLGESTVTARLYGSNQLIQNYITR